MRPLSVGASGAFHPATDHHTMVLIFCKEISTKCFSQKPAPALIALAMDGERHRRPRI
jgi:hypothetical protein